ncbi:MAG: hypothetical protein AB1626_01045 [Candidatus Micrarchaeota archaeon]
MEAGEPNYEREAESHEMHLVDDVFAGNFLQRHRANLYILFFPGLILHELAHALAVWASGGRVTEARLWSMRGGEIKVRSLGHVGGVITAFAPFALAVASVLILQYAFGQLHVATNEGLWWPVLLLWLAASLALYSIPSVGDMNHAIWRLRRLRRTGETFLSGISALLWFFPSLLLEAIAKLHIAVYRQRTYVRFLWLGVLAFATLNYFSA